MAWSGEPVRVRVPATSANLGPGFDTLGLALALHDEVEARVTTGGLSIEITGEGASLSAAGEDHLVVTAMRAAFDDLGGPQPPGIALRCRNKIPHGRGLGSSAAAIAAGILAARALAGAPGTPELILPLATKIEGHPDNVAACLFGGLTIAWGSDAVRLEPLATITPVAIIAPAPIRTEVARSVLPAQVPYKDAAFNAARSALLVAALTARPDVLLEATDDRLHQGYRAAAMPATHRLMRLLRQDGIPAFVSGAGPSVLALATNPSWLDRMDSIASETGSPWHISPLDVERHGASLLNASPPYPNGEDT